MEQLARQTEHNLERGFRAIKMKVGRDRLSEDVQRVAEMRKLLGPEIPLMVDANMRWTVEQAIRASRAFAEYDVYWLEEPTIPDDVDGHRRIQSEGGFAGGKWRKPPYAVRISEDDRRRWRVLSRA